MITLTGDLPRTWNKATYKFYSWWVRKTFRDNKEEITKVVTDQIIYGTGYWSLSDEGKVKHLSIDDLSSG